MSTAEEETPLVTSKPPFLRRIRIRGYKSIADAEVTFEPLTILVGRNASGKSNVLDALSFLSAVLDVGLTEAVHRHGGWHAVLHHASPDRQVAIEVDVAFALDASGRRLDEPDAEPSFAASFGIVFTADEHGVPVLLREYLRHPELGFDHAHAADRLRLSRVDASPTADIADGLRWCGVYQFEPRAVRRWHRPMPGVLLTSDGGNVASVLAGMRAIDPRAAERVGQYVNAVTRDIVEVRSVRHGECETVRFVVRTDEGQGRAEFDAASMSDGVLRALGVFAAVFQSVAGRGAPSVVAIDGVEVGLHPAAMRAVAAALGEATLRTQVVVTTHSADLLDAEKVTPANVRVVQMFDGQTLVFPVEEFVVAVRFIRDGRSTLGREMRDEQLQLERFEIERRNEPARQPQPQEQESAVP